MDLYSAYHGLPLEPLSRLQYLQFQILLSLVLIQSSTKKRKVSTICFIEIVFFKKVVSSAYGQQQWQWSKIVKPLIPGFDFIRWNKICKAKIRKQKLGYLGGCLSQAEYLAVVPPWRTHNFWSPNQTFTHEMKFLLKSYFCKAEIDKLSSNE